MTGHDDSCPCLYCTERPPPKRTTHPATCDCKQCVPNVPFGGFDPRLEAEFRKSVAQPAAKPCACAPGCGNEADPEQYLCSDCARLWGATEGFRRAIAQKTSADMKRQLADWARTRSAELINGSKP